MIIDKGNPKSFKNGTNNSISGQMNNLQKENIFLQALLKRQNRLVCAWDKHGEIYFQSTPSLFKSMSPLIKEQMEGNILITSALEKQNIDPLLFRERILEFPLQLENKNYWFREEAYCIEENEKKYFILSIEDQTQSSQEIKSAALYTEGLETMLQQQHIDLSERERRYRQVVDMITDFVIQANFIKQGQIDARIVWATDTFQKLTGYDIGEFNDMPFHHYAHHKDATSLSNCLRSTLAETNGHLEWRMKTKSGHFKWFKMNIRPLANNKTGVHGFLAGFSDISPQKNMENKIAIYQQELENAVYQRGVELKEQTHSRMAAEKELSNLRNKVLQLQMNPHFLFNTLIAIQSFIYRDDKAQASAYLNDFAQLVRIMLDNTNKQLISLEREIKALKHYLRLQKLRFSEIFDFEIDIEEKCNYYHLMIPPLLAQPFIENSIEHGFKGRKTKGKITVQFRFDSNKLYYIIEDNGIGRDQSKKMDKNTITLAKSGSVDTTIERLNQFNIQHKTNILLEIKDLYNTSNQACGTRVTIIIPLQQ